MKKVFIASRFKEFKEIREKLRKELLDCNLYPIDLNDNQVLYKWTKINKVIIK